MCDLTELVLIDMPMPKKDGLTAFSEIRKLRERKAGRIIYRASKLDCERCQMKALCCY